MKEARVVAKLTCSSSPGCPCWLARLTDWSVSWPAPGLQPWSSVQHHPCNNIINKSVFVNFLTGYWKHFPTGYWKHFLTGYWNHFLTGYWKHFLTGYWKHFLTGYWKKTFPYRVLKTFPYRVLKTFPYRVLKTFPYRVLKKFPYSILKTMLVICIVWYKVQCKSWDTSLKKVLMLNMLLILTTMLLSTYIFHL